jgi:hypothetical protein
MSAQTGAFVGLALSLAACAPTAAHAASPPNAHVLLAQACATSDRAYCESAEIACLRDCSAAATAGRSIDANHFAFESQKSDVARATDAISP